MVIFQFEFYYEPDSICLNYSRHLNLSKLALWKLGFANTIVRPRLPKTKGKVSETISGKSHLLPNWTLNLTTMRNLEKYRLSIRENAHPQ